jgi:acetyltransferase-like isoleucine patch superfamily enzyme
MFSKSRIPVTNILTEGMLPSRLQRQLYRRRGYRIASDVEFAPGVVIQAEEVEIGPGTSFGLATVIRGKRVQIGRRVQIGSFSIFEGRDIFIGDDTVIREQVFVGGPLLPDSTLDIGKRVKVFQTCFLNPSRPLKIGDDTGVGGRSSIFTHGSWQSAIDGYPVAFAPVTIGRNVWLPWHVFILPGVEIGDNATVGAGSLLNRSVPEGSFVAGVPAKVIKTAEEWPRPIDEQHQWSLACSIFDELLDYLQDNGAVISRSGDTKRLEATISFGGTSQCAALVQRHSEARPEYDVVVALQGDEVPEAVDMSGGTSWFVLREKRKGGPASGLSEEVEEFFGRYGLRFAPAHEA